MMHSRSKAYLANVITTWQVCITKDMAFTAVTLNAKKKS